MKFSYVYLVSALFALALVAADEVQSNKSDSVNEKWIGNWWLGGYGNYYRLGWGRFSLGPDCLALAGYYGGLSGYWFSSAEAQASKRSVDQLESHPSLVERGEQSYNCKSSTGEIVAIRTNSCRQAAAKLASGKVSSASCGSCQLSLVSEKGEITSSKIPLSELQSTAENLLKNCENGGSKHARRSGGFFSKRRDQKASFAVVLSKGDGSQCH